MIRWIIPITTALVLGAAFAYAQVYNGPPNPTALVCAFNTSPPAPVAGKFYYVQCDSQGRIIIE